MYTNLYLDNGVCPSKKKRRKAFVRKKESIKENSYRYATVLEG